MAKGASWPRGLVVLVKENHRGHWVDSPEVKRPHIVCATSGWRFLIAEKVCQAVPLS